MQNNKRLLLLSVVFVVLMLGFTIFGAYAVTSSSMQRAEQTGRQIAENYRLKDQTLFTEYRMTLDHAARTLSKMRADQASLSEIHQWMVDYTEEIISSDTSCYTGIYGDFDGVFLTGESWEQPAGFDPSARQWYQEAIRNPGEIYYSDLYVDARTGEQVISLSMQINETDVIGIDVLIENIQNTLSSELLAEGCLQATFDRNGQLIGHKCWLADKGAVHTTEYLEELYAQIMEHPDQENFRYQDSNGIQQIVYSIRGDTGWLSVSSVQYTMLTSSYARFATVFGVAITIYFVVMGWMMWHNYRNVRSAWMNERVLTAMGDLYYEVYLISLPNGDCRRIKPTGNPHKILYPQWIEEIAARMKPESAKEFREKFRLEAIMTALSKGGESTGWEFEQDFGGHYEWVFAQMLMDTERLHKNEVVLAFRHIHGQKRLELKKTELLKESLAAAQAASQAKNDFLSHMSHDMRTPLNAIIGLSELAQMHAGCENEVVTYLDKIRISSKQLLELINDILDMAKIEQGKLDLKEEPFDLEKLVREVIGIFEQQAIAQRKTLVLSLDVENRFVEGDVLRITQVLNNIVSNALKFTPEGGKIEVEIRQSASDYRDQGIYQMTVRDTGIGMSREFLGKVFLPFEQENRLRNSQVGGTGLGMPIVQNIVRRMNGQIDVQSEIGKGSTFTVSLPLRYQQLPDPAPVPAEAEQPPENKLVGKRLLLVEDNEINMEIAQEILQTFGAEVTPAWNGQEAVDLFERSEPGSFDAILMDMQMPVLDGCGAARAIRALKRSDAAAIPIIAVTANAFSDDIARSMEAGMNAHLSKPLDFDLLYQTLCRLLEV